MLTLVLLTQTWVSNVTGEPITTKMKFYAEDPAVAMRNCRDKEKVLCETFETMKNDSAFLSCTEQKDGQEEQSNPGHDCQHLDGEGPKAPVADAPQK
jgi:hypothetical protein